jgi:hypothetical protein
VKFYTNGLLSKFGFEDGDMLDDMLDWAGYAGLDQVHHFTVSDEYDSFSFYHVVLSVAVCAYVVPALDQRVDIELLHTIHNPVRANRVDGQRVESWYDSPFTLTPEFVEVADETVLALARALCREIPDGG